MATTATTREGERQETERLPSNSSPYARMLVQSHFLVPSVSAPAPSFDDDAGCLAVCKEQASARPLDVRGFALYTAVLKASI